MYLSSLGADTDAVTAGNETGGVDAADIYVRYCSACHGVRAQGALRGPVADTSLSRSELIAAATDGLGSTPKYSGSMALEEIEAVSEFVLRLRPGTGEASLMPFCLPTTTTERLYAQLCAARHGATGQGRDTVTPFGDGLDAATVSVVNRNGGDPAPDNARPLSESAFDARI